MGGMAATAMVRVTGSAILGLGGLDLWNRFDVWVERYGWRWLDSDFFDKGCFSIVC